MNKPYLNQFQRSYNQQPSKPSVNVMRNIKAGPTETKKEIGYYLLVAGSFREAEEWARSNELERQCWRYVGNMQYLEGVQNSKVVLLGTYELRSMSERISRHLNALSKSRNLIISISY